MVLCLAAVDLGLAAVELTDGWYSVWAACDEPLAAQLRRGRLRTGLKLRLWGCTAFKAEAEPKRAAENDDNPSPPPWEAGGRPDAPRLQLHANGTRRAPWDAILGLCRRRLFRVDVDSLQANGGRAPSLRVLIARVHGPLVFEKGESSSRWRTLSEAQAVDEAAHERAVVRQIEWEARREARQARVERRPGVADGSDDDDGDDNGPGREEPARKSLVWRVVVVDADAGRTEKARRAPAVQTVNPNHGDGGEWSSASEALMPPPTMGVLSIWSDYGGGEDVGADGPVEGQTGWVLGASVQTNDNITSTFGASGSRGLSLETARGAPAWVADREHCRLSMGRDAPARQQQQQQQQAPSAAGGAADTNAGAAGATARLSACGLARRHTPIPALVHCPSGICFDTVGYLVYASAPTVTAASWGGARESRKLFLCDGALQLLCVNWVRSPDEPLPRLRPGAPVALLDARYEWSHYLPEGVPWGSWSGLPQGSEHLPAAALATTPVCVVHHAIAEAVGFQPARLLSRCGGGRGSGSASAARGEGSHLRSAFEDLTTHFDARREALTKLAGLGLELVSGRVVGGGTSVPTAFQQHPQALLCPPPRAFPTPQPAVPPTPTTTTLEPHQATGSTERCIALSLMPLSSPPILPILGLTPWQRRLQEAVHAQLASAAPDGLSAAEVAARCSADSSLTSNGAGGGASEGDASGGDASGGGLEVDVADVLTALTESFQAYEKAGTFFSL